jgi:hypothetical protein
LKSISDILSSLLEYFSPSFGIIVLDSTLFKLNPQQVQLFSSEGSVL